MRILYWLQVLLLGHRLNNMYPSRIWPICLNCGWLRSKKLCRYFITTVENSEDIALERNHASQPKPWLFLSQPQFKQIGHIRLGYMLFNRWPSNKTCNQYNILVTRNTKKYNPMYVLKWIYGYLFHRNYFLCYVVREITIHRY
jgi:hypothetical protein